MMSLVESSKLPLFGVRSVQNPPCKGLSGCPETHALCLTHRLLEHLTLAGLVKEGAPEMVFPTIKSRNSGSETQTSLGRPRRDSSPRLRPMRRSPPALLEGRARQRQCSWRRSCLVTSLGPTGRSKCGMLIYPFKPSLKEVTLN